MAPHQYVVGGRGRDDVNEEEFWRMVELIKTQGRRELRLSSKAAVSPRRRMWPGEEREPSPTDSEDNMSETVWILGPTKSRPPGKLRYHTSPDCPMARMYKAKAVDRQEAESQGYTRCRRNGPCNSATKAGPRPGRNRQMVTAGKR